VYYEQKIYEMAVKYKSNILKLPNNKDYTAYTLRKKIFEANQPC